MKKIVLLIISLFYINQTINAQTVVLDTNGITLKYTGTTVPSPYFIQASPRGTLEWFAIVNNSTKSNITDYANNIASGRTYFAPTGIITPIYFNNIVTTLVTDMNGMFSNATDFNQPIGSWDVSNVNNMSYMFYNANTFNQPISSWNVSNVINMSNMFSFARSFNQSIENWNVSNVTNMSNMFWQANSFDQPIGSWNVSKVNNMSYMFFNATAFNQPIGSWNVGNVTNMYSMFPGANAFNQPIGDWNVSNVNDMRDMFYNAGLSTANYDALLIGWSTISPNENPLKLYLSFSGGNSKYCNGTTARSSIISTYGWTITDAGLNCALDTEEFETNSFKLYPNPVVSVLNIKTDNQLINQPYTIIDGLGRVVLNGKLNDVESTINVEQLSKGIYYLKISGNSASKFIKE